MRKDATSVRKLPIMGQNDRRSPTMNPVLLPRVFSPHPESNVPQAEDSKPLTLFVPKEGISSYFQWLKSEYGFSEDKVRPYTFNPQPFLVNGKSAMQGYVTPEPFAD